MYSTLQHVNYLKKLIECINMSNLRHHGGVPVLRTTLLYLYTWMCTAGTGTYLCVRARVWSVSNVHMWRFMYVWSMYVAITWMYNVLCTQASRRLLKYLSHYSWTVIYIIFSQYYLCATLCDHSIGAWISRYMNVMNSCPCNWAPLDIWQWFPLRCIESASGSKDGQWAGFKTTPP